MKTAWKPQRIRPCNKPMPRCCKEHVWVEGKGYQPVQLEKLDFHLTRPFLYAIESRDGTVLFIGTVTVPGTNE